MAASRILVVEDEDKLRAAVRLYLEKEGFGVGEAADGRAALDRLAREQWDLIILDLMLPEVDGWTVCRELQRLGGPPVIILTARDAEVDRVLGLELGADDYVVKPFSPRELVARVRAVLRRAQKAAVPDAGPRPLSFRGLSIDPASREVQVGSQRVSLTPTEYELISFLARSPGRIYSRDELLTAVWGYDYAGDTRTVDTHVNRLRDKLLQADPAARYLQTAWGVGYKFEVPREPV